MASCSQEGTANDPLSRGISDVGPIVPAEPTPSVAEAGGLCDG
jgi:hypothetical protein